MVIFGSEILAASALFVLGVKAVDNGLAITPQMGCKFTSSQARKLGELADADDVKGITGTPSAATSPKSCSCKPQNSSSTTDSKT